MKQIAWMIGLMWLTLPALAEPGASPSAVKDVIDRTQKELVTIPAGRFSMGSPSYEGGRATDEGPIHAVSVSSFEISKYLVRRGQFAAFVKDTGYDTGNSCFILVSGRWAERSGYNWRNPGFEQTDGDPVVCVNWNDAKAYVEWLSHNTDQDYALPSEAQWEYAARAGSKNSHFWGGNADEACIYANVADRTARNALGLGDKAYHNCDDRALYTTTVGVYKPNSFGLYDMLGNAWEWVEDCYHKDFNGAPTDGSAWITPGCTEHVLRGGSWYSRPQIARSADRYASMPTSRDYDHGFRVIRIIK